MNKKSFKILTTCFMVSILSILILYLISAKRTINQRQNFHRFFKEDIVGERYVLDVKYNSYYIAGASKNEIYLANYTNPFHLLVSNLTLTDTQRFQLTIKNRETLNLTQYLRIKVLPPYFYFIDGSMPAILRGKLKEWQATRFIYDSLFFFDAIPITNTSFAIRALGFDVKENVIGKEYNNPPYFKIENNLLEKQFDGLFCTSGDLHYSKELNKLVYIYSYRNQYLVIDTCLNLESKGKTIDTISRAQIKPKYITSEQSHTLASPPSLTNKKSCLYGRWLFVHSALLAKNEDEDVFDNSSTIDVYDVSNHKYNFSFHLPKYNNEEIKSFQVQYDFVIMIYDHYLIKYDLNTANFSGAFNTNISIK